MPHEQIVTVAKDCQADVIIMGATGRTGLTRLLLGSTTRRVLQQLPCSLLTVKEADVVEQLFQDDLRTINLLMAEGRELMDARDYLVASTKFRRVLARNPFHVAQRFFWPRLWINSTGTRKPSRTVAAPRGCESRSGPKQRQ